MIVFREQSGSRISQEEMQNSGWIISRQISQTQPPFASAKASLFGLFIMATACGVGTAGTAYSQASSPVRSGPHTLVMEAIRLRNSDEDVLDIGDILSTIRLAFGLKVAELANILQVERQTIYGWMDESKQQKLHAKNSDRIKAILELARTWLHHTREPARKWLIAPAGGTGSSSLLEEMSRAKIDSGRLLATLTSISKSVSRTNSDDDLLDKWRARGLATPPSEFRSHAIPARSESNE